MMGFLATVPCHGASFLPRSGSTTETHDSSLLVSPEKCLSLTQAGKSRGGGWADGSPGKVPEQREKERERIHCKTNRS